MTGPCGAKGRAGEAAAVCLPPKDPGRRVWFPASQPSKTEPGLSGGIGLPNAKGAGKIKPALFAGAQGDIK